MDLNFPKLEEKILRFWKENKIFEKSVDSRKGSKKFIFYEGPPTANAAPGIHHLLARAFKDIILRYKTMKGFYIERKAGWDTHGLPVELQIEKKLGLKSKKDIEKYGISKFNKKCKESVWRYKEDWEKLTERIGFWLDMENPYITYENNYIETLWWILKQVWQKRLLYQDYKVVPYCPRCGTILSSHEVAQGYKRTKEPAIYVKFKIQNSKFQNTFLLVWTTTPWTLPGNVAIAVNPEFTYAKVKVNDEYLILAKERIGNSGIKGEVLQEFKGKELVGLEYEPLFDFVNPKEKAYYLVSGNFVSLEEGTGLVHIAPAFGEEDMVTGKENNLPILLNVDEEGKFKSEVKNWQGLFVKDADPLIIEDLKKRNLLFKEELYEHDYPFCWRCNSSLLYYSKESWFIQVTKLKKDLIKNNQKINWIPTHLKEGRFGEWLREIKDWAISRERYWGTPLPIWQCQRCNKQICIGSIKELTQKSRKKIKDLHRPYIDKITFKCEKCGELMKRVPEVIDCWFDSGAMPFAQYHYPFENKNLINKKEQFPADYISEGVDQTRGWFYTLLAISTLLGFGPPYKNVISVGHVLDEKGEKMSKSKGNVVDSWEIVGKYGADSLRWYFYTVNQAGEPKLFSEKDVSNVLKRFIMILWNCFSFFQTYRGSEKLKTQTQKFKKSKNLLDKWIISKLNRLISTVTNCLDGYDITSAARAIEDFVVNNLSQWYIRRSRLRFQKPENKKEKRQATETLYFTLLNLVKLIAPMAPFLAEEIYQNLKTKNMPESVHLYPFPKPEKEKINLKLEKKMQEIREIVSLVLAERMTAGIKVRQPLLKLEIRGKRLEKELIDLIKDEVNVKNIVFNEKLKTKVKLDTEITPELKEEGTIREIIRQIQEMRKEAKLKPLHKVISYVLGTPELNKILLKNKDFILKTARLKDLKLGEKPPKAFDIKKEAEIDGKKLWLAIKKV